MMTSGEIIIIGAIDVLETIVPKLVDMGGK